MREWKKQIKERHRGETRGRESVKGRERKRHETKRQNAGVSR